MNIQELFLKGMKREMGSLIDPPGTRLLDLGAGKNPYPGADVLDWPGWNGQTDPIPREDETVDGIFAFHFLEHLPGDAVVRVLRECERVLVPGGVLTTVIPHRLGSIAFQDLDHKSFWTEETWRTLFQNDYYDKHREQPWLFEVRFNVIIGIVERNLSLMSQLQKRRGK